MFAGNSILYLLLSKIDKKDKIKQFYSICSQGFQFYIFFSSFKSIYCGFHYFYKCRWLFRRKCITILYLLLSKIDKKHKIFSGQAGRSSGPPRRVSEIAVICGLWLPPEGEDSPSIAFKQVSAFIVNWNITADILTRIAHSLSLQWTPVEMLKLYANIAVTSLNVLILNRIFPNERKYACTRFAGYKWRKVYSSIVNHSIDLLIMNYLCSFISCYYSMYQISVKS